MAAAEKKPAGAGLARIFGDKPKAGAKPDAESSAEDMGEGGTEEVPPEFQSAYDEWQANQTPETTWRMIKACVDGGY